MRAAPLLLAAVVCTKGPAETTDAPRQDVAVAALAFGVHPPGCPITRPVRVHNGGTRTLAVTSVAITGDGAAEFSVVPDQPFELAPGKERLLEVTYLPTGDGRADATLVIEGNDPSGATDTLALSGDGDPLPDIVGRHVQAIHERGDVALVVDTTCSMGGTISNAAARIGAFIDTYTGLGLDVHIGVLTAEMGTDVGDGRLVGPWVAADDLDAAATLSRHLTSAQASLAPMRAFAAARSAVTARSGDSANKGFRRPEVPLGFVAITGVDDADAVKASSATDDLIGWLDTVAGESDRASWSSLTCDAAGDDCAQVRRAAIDSGGVTGALNDDPGKLDAFLRSAALASVGLSDRFPLPTSPALPDDVLVEVDGVPVLRWRVEDAWVVFDPDAIPAPGAVVTIRARNTSCPASE